MSNKNITIPADLWLDDNWTPRKLRNMAGALRGELNYSMTPRLLERLADEIERQTRKPGWYHVSLNDTDNERVYWWNGSEWRLVPHEHSPKAEQPETYSNGFTVTPVTIGAES